MAPALVLLTTKSDMQKRPPLRPARFADELHLRLVREAVAFARVTGNAGADDIFPCREAAFIARKDVVEIQFAALKNLTAILTGVVIALEDIVPGELYFLLRQPVEQEEHDHARHPDFPSDSSDHFVLWFWRGEGEIAPAGEIMGREIILPIGEDDLGVPLVKKGKGSTRRADVHRLPEAVKDEHLTVQ